MSLLEIVLISFGLAMDAFAVSICKGLSMKKMNWKKALIIAAYFGGFQAIMPLVGFLLGNTLSGAFESIDHWVAFILLGIIGAEMIKNSFDKEEDKRNDKVDIKTMTILATATSIDALAIGVTFSFLRAKIILSAIIIGVITFVLSLIGVKTGNKFGDKLQNKAELIGGIILIFLGIKILLEHLGVL